VTAVSFFFSILRSHSLSKRIYRLFTLRVIYCDRWKRPLLFDGAVFHYPATTVLRFSRRRRCYDLLDDDGAAVRATALQTLADLTVVPIGAHRFLC
jgi:hypothetical protein